MVARATACLRASPVILGSIPIHSPSCAGSLRMHRTQRLVIPTIGTIDAVLISWEQTTNAELRSGEKVVLEFFEDQEKRFLLDSILIEMGSQLKSVVDDLEGEAIPERNVLQEMLALGDNAITAVSEAYDKLQAIVDMGREVRDGIDARVQVIAAKIEGLANLCSEVERTLQNPISHVLLDSIKNVWAAAVDLSDQIAGTKSPQTRTFTVPRSMSVQELSLAIYGRTEFTLDLLTMNNFEEPSRIPAGTVARYLAGIE